MADLINDNKRKTAGGDLRLGSTSNPPDALPSVEAPVPVDLPAKQSAPIPIPVPPPGSQQVSKVSNSPPSIVAPPARQPVMAVHLDPVEDAQVAAETAAIREAANDPLPGAEYVPPAPPWEATFPTVRGTGEQYNRPQEMTAEQAAAAYLQPDANKAVAAQHLERVISNEAINTLGPDDFIPYMINQPGLRNLVAETSQQRQSIFAQYTNENKQNADYAAALTAQVEADRQAKNSSTSDGLDWVRTIIGQRDGTRKYNAPVQFNQQTQQYDTNLLGAILYPLGVIQNTAIGAALDGRQLIRQLGNVIPPQHREFADRFIRRTPLFKQLGVAQWVLNGNKYDDGKSNIIEAIRGAQYSFSDDAGEGVGIGVQAGAFKTPKLPIVGEVGVNPSKLLGFAGDVLIGAKLDKVVKAAAKRLGIGARALPPPAAATVSAPKRPQLPPSPQRAQLPPARSPIQSPGGAVKGRPRQLPPASQQVVVLPPPRRAYTPQPRLPATAPRKLLMPSRVAELRSPLNATPKENLQLLKPVVAKPLQPLNLSAKVKEQQDVITAILEVPVTKVLPVISKATSPVVKLIKEQLNQTEWWGTPQGMQLATHLDDLLTAAPQKVEAALEKAGVDVEQLRQVVDDIVPATETRQVISEVQQQLPQLDEVSTAVNESLVAQEVRKSIKQSQQDAIRQQSDTLDVGRNQLDDELLPEVSYSDSIRVELPLTPLKNSKAYHGTRVKDLSIENIDPITGSARNELGSGVYTYGSKASAAMPARADAAINLPDLPGREFGDGVIHEVQLSGNVLDGKAQLPQLRQLADQFATPEIKAALDASGDNSVVGILDTVGANTAEEAALQFQQKLTQALRDNGVQHIKAGEITSTIDTRAVVTQGVTPVKGAGADIPHEAMLRNRLKMERDAVEQTGSQFLKSTTADTAVRVESQALDEASEAMEAAQLKTYDAVKRSGLLDDVVPQPRDLSVTPTSQATSRADDVISRYVETAKRSSDDYITGLAEGRVPAKRGENFTALVRDILDGHVDDQKLISLLEGKYTKLYDSVADRIYNESYSKLLPTSVKQVSTAIDDVMAEISSHPPQNVPPELQSKLDDLLDQIDDEAFDRKFNDALKSDAPPAKNADNPSSPCDI